MQSREASHAGSWYSDNQRTLTHQLDGWLAQVPNSIEGIGSLPVPGARIIIAPYVPENISAPCTVNSYADPLDMRAIHTLGPVPHTHTRLWIFRKRTCHIPTPTWIGPKLYWK